jgi:hypothetical protein
LRRFSVPLLILLANSTGASGGAVSLSRQVPSSPDSGESTAHENSPTVSIATHTPFPKARRCVTSPRARRLGHCHRESGPSRLAGQAGWPPTSAGRAEHEGRAIRPCEWGATGHTVTSIDSSASRRGNSGCPQDSNNGRKSLKEPGPRPPYHSFRLTCPFPNARGDRPIARWRSLVGSPGGANSAG